MATISPYMCELDCETNTTLKMYFFKNIKNLETLRSKVIEGEWTCGVVNAELVVDPLQVTVAANAAVVAHHRGTMVTRTVYGEILYNLSLTKNISQSLSNFGINKGRDLLLCFLVTPDSDNSEDIIPQIEGDLCPMTELSTVTNMKEIKSAYKLNNLKDNVGLLDIIVTRIATKSFVSH